MEDDEIEEVEIEREIEDDLDDEEVEKEEEKDKKNAFIKSIFLFDFFILIFIIKLIIIKLINMSRFWKLKAIYKELKNSWKVQSYLWLENKEDIQDIIEQNREAIFLSLSSEIENLNSKQSKKALRKFLKDNLNSLSIRELWDMLSKISYYLDIYEEFNVNWWSEKLDDEILVDKNSFSPNEILYELLVNNVLLPEYKNQKEFNEEMLKLLPRVEKTINKFLKTKRNLIIPSFNYIKILEYIKDREIYEVVWSKLISDWIIKQIAYNFYFWEYKEINENNEFSISFLINEEWLLTREEFIRFLNETLKLKDIWNNKEFAYESDFFNNYTIYVWEEMFEREYESLDNFTEDGEAFIYNWFEVKVYATPKRNFSLKESFVNISNWLPAVTERLINEIYYTYWIIDWEEEWIPEKVILFDVEKHLWTRTIDDLYEDDWWNLEVWQVGIWLTNKAKLNSYNKSLEIEDISLDDLVLRDSLKSEIEFLIRIYKNRDFFIDNGWEIPTWLLLYWVPGWWKTTIAKILSKQSDSWFFIVEPNIQWEYVWQSENNLKSRFDEAKKYIDNTWKNAIIFIDEAENLFPIRWDKDHKEWMLAVLLTEMDWIDEKYNWKITYVFATNRKDILDPALLSRIDKSLEIPIPTKEELVKILDIHIRKKMKLCKDKMYEKADLDLEQIAEKILWKTWRFVKKLIKNVHNKWLEKLLDDKKFTITTEFILDQIKFTEISEKKEIRMWFKV